MRQEPTLQPQAVVVANLALFAQAPAQLPLPALQASTAGTARSFALPVLPAAPRPSSSRAAVPTTLWQNLISQPPPVALLMQPQWMAAQMGQLRRQISAHTQLLAEVSYDSYSQDLKSDI